jgi:hypothetical protein
MLLTNPPLRTPDTDGSHVLEIKSDENLTGDRNLKVVLGDQDRTLALQGNPALGDWFDQSVKTTAEPSFAGLFLSGQQIGRLVTISANYQMTELDFIVLANAISGPITVTLPPVAEAVGQVYTVKRISNTAHAVTVVAGT